MLGSPKKLPMLVYTAEYLANAYSHGHDGIVIDGVFLTNGCNRCENPDIEEAAKILRDAGIKVFLTGVTGASFETPKNIEFLSDVYESIHMIRGESDQTLERYLKDHRINYYFYKTLDKALEQFPSADYVLFMEDDQAYKKDLFKKLKPFFDGYSNGNEKFIGTNTVFCASYIREGIDRHHCSWGFYGKLFSNEELKRFLKMQKFEKYIRCGDVAQCDWFFATKWPSRVINLGYHFGRDSNIQRKDPRFY